MEGSTRKHSTVYEATKVKSILQKSKVNEARVIDFSGIQRKEDVNEVSELSTSPLSVFALPSGCSHKP